MQASPFEWQPVVAYATPHYPQAPYRPPPPTEHGLLVRRVRRELMAVAVGLAIPSLLGGCGFTQTSGDPPMRQSFLSESDARARILTHFEGAGIVAQPADFAQGDVSMLVDGFDASLGIGYQYVGEWDGGESVPSADERLLLNEWLDADGPYFLVLDAQSYPVEGGDARSERLTELSLEVEAFLAYLTSRGVL